MLDANNAGYSGAACDHSSGTDPSDGSRLDIC